MSSFGLCNKCHVEIEPVYFLEKQYKNGHPTGMVRKAVDCLVCPVCLDNICVDDSFNGPWYKKQTKND